MPMHMFKTKFLFLSLFLWGFVTMNTRVWAQDILMNYQQQYTRTVPASAERYETAGKYAQVLFFNQQTAKAFDILNENVETAEKNRDYKYAAYLFAILSMNHRIEEHYQASQHNIEKAQLYSSRTRDAEIRGYVSYCEGWLNVRNNEESKAVQNFLNAVKWYEQSPSSPTLLSRLSSVYKELTSIYANWDEEELHEKYSKLSLDVAIRQNNPTVLFDAYMAMGYLYEQRLILQPADIRFRDQSENYYLKAVETYMKNKNEIPFPSNLSFVANNLANLYYHYYPQHYHEKALHYAELALEVGIKTGQTSHIASSYGIMSEMALEKNETKKAKSYLLKALMEIHKGALADQNIVLAIYNGLTKIYESEDNYAEALRYQKMYLETFKIIYDQEKLEIGKRLESQFEKERQQQQMLRLKLESEKKEQQIQLMHALGIQQLQELENSKLNEEFQRKKLKLSELQSEKRTQELELSRLENQNRITELSSYKRELSFRERINKYYISLLVVFGLLLALMLYSMKQRKKSMKQREDLYNLELEKERQHSKISTLTALLDGQEQERTRLARDLHDGLGGLLSGTKIQLTHLKDQLDAPAKPGLKKSIAQLDDAVNELRRVAHNLMPELLTKYGLEEALREYATRMSSPKLDIDVQFLSYTSSLDQEQQLLVYRIIQELVNNAVKHADPHQIIIQFVEEDLEYSVVVEDDGNGFDVEGLHSAQSAGLSNIETRIQFLKGKLSIHSEINLGTSIEFQFPKIRP